jgi:hypothetical protein
MTDVEDAERDVATTKQQLQESLRLAGEAGTRLAVAARKKVTPTLVVAVVAGVAIVAGVTLVAARNSSRPRRRASGQPTLTGILARAAGTWLVRAIALRVAVKMAEKFRDPQTSSTPAVFAAHARAV